MTEADHRTVAEFLHRTVQLALALQKEAGSKLLKDFLRVAEGSEEVRTLRGEVRAFARKWPLPGVDVSNIVRPAGIEEEDLDLVKSASAGMGVGVGYLGGSYPPFWLGFGDL